VIKTFIDDHRHVYGVEPIWESDFHRLSYGFRPERSVHHAIRTVKPQLQDSSETAGRWAIEGDLASYFDTVHHKQLMNCVRKRICDRRFLALLWLSLPRYRHGHEPRLNGEPHALRGARAVRGGEAGK
jgi:retron-type reverse transcriptase